MSTLSKARSKSFGSSEASTLCAISTKRLWRSASVSFGNRFGFGVIGHTIIKPRRTICGISMGATRTPSPCFPLNFHRNPLNNVRHQGRRVNEYAKHCLASWAACAYSVKKWSGKLVTDHDLIETAMGDGFLAFRAFSVSVHGFAPESVGTCQDSESGDGRHSSSPLSNGNSSCRGSGSIGRQRRHERWRLGRVRSPLATSCFVSKPLALGANQGEIGALQVVDAEPDAVGISKVKLAQIPLQMSL